MEGVQFDAEMSSKGSCSEGMLPHMALMEDSGSPCEVLANWAYPPRNCGTHLSPPIPVCGMYLSVCLSSLPSLPLPSLHPSLVPCSTTHSDIKH